MGSLSRASFYAPAVAVVVKNGRLRRTDIDILDTNGMSAWWTTGLWSIRDQAGWIALRVLTFEKANGCFNPGEPAPCM